MLHVPAAASMSSIAASGDDISSYKESSQSLADLAAEQQTPANAETHAAKVGRAHKCRHVGHACSSFEGAIPCPMSVVCVWYA